MKQGNPHKNKAWVFFNPFLVFKLTTPHQSSCQWGHTADQWNTSLGIPKGSLPIIAIEICGKWFVLSQTQNWLGAADIMGKRKNSGKKKEKRSGEKQETRGRTSGQDRPAGAQQNVINTINSPGICKLFWNIALWIVFEFQLSRNVQLLYHRFDGDFFARSLENWETFSNKASN